MVRRAPKSPLITKRGRRAIKMIRRLVIAAALGLPFMASAAPLPNLMGEAVQLRALDKVTARTFDYTVPIGESLEFGSLTIHAKHCEKTPPTSLPETYAFLQIDDRRLMEDGSEDVDSARLFSGWMFASRPAISALDHRVYDVWVIGCTIPQQPAGLDGIRRSNDYTPDRL